MFKTKEQRRGAKRAQEFQCEDMLEQSAMQFRPVNIDDTVLVPVEDVDRSKLDPPNLHALVIDVIGEVGYKLAVTSGVLKGVFSRHHFKHSPTNFLSRSDINFERVDLAVRTASRLQSFNKDQKPTKCGCKGQFSKKHCKCKRNIASVNVIVKKDARTEILNFVTVTYSIFSYRVSHIELDFMNWL